MKVVLNYDPLTYLARRRGGAGLCSTSPLLLPRLLPLPLPLCPSPLPHQLGQVELQAPGDGDAEKWLVHHLQEQLLHPVWEGREGREGSTSLQSH